MQDAPPQPVPGPSAGAPGREPGPASTGPVGDPYSSMAERFNWPFRWFARRFFQHFELDPQQSATLRSLETGGAVVYVMRYASRLDYFLLTFTIPDKLWPLCKAHPKELYDLLLRESAGALQDVAQTKLGGRLGFTSVFHSWGRPMQHHPPPPHRSPRGRLRPETRWTA